MSLYEELASATDGKVVNSADDLSLLTEEIMERFDSLPRVEEVEGTQDLPTLKITSIENISETEVKISFETDAVKILVAVNDAIMGVVDENSITISGLDKARENIVSLMPLSENRRGAAETITIDGRGEDDGKIIIPRVPDTGVVRR